MHALFSTNFLTTPDAPSARLNVWEKKQLSTFAALFRIEIPAAHNVSRLMSQRRIGAGVVSAQVSNRRCRVEAFRNHPSHPGMGMRMHMQN